MTELQLELDKIENGIRSAVTSGDEFEYHKLLRAKTEAESKLFFQRQKETKAEIESLISERNAAFELIDDLTKDLAIQADKVRQLRSQAYDEQEKHNQISFKLHVLRTKTENDRETIRDLQQKLDLATDKKLNPESYDESGNLKRKVEENAETII